jgi:hypothetical protein
MQHLTHCTAFLIRPIPQKTRLMMPALVGMLLTTGVWAEPTARLANPESCTTARPTETRATTDNGPEKPIEKDQKKPPSSGIFWKALGVTAGVGGLVLGAIAAKKAYDVYQIIQQCQALPSKEAQIRFMFAHRWTFAFLLSAKHLGETFGAWWNGTPAKPGDAAFEAYLQANLANGTPLTDQEWDIMRKGIQLIEDPSPPAISYETKLALLRWGLVAWQWVAATWSKVPSWRTPQPKQP